MGTRNRNVQDDRYGYARIKKQSKGKQSSMPVRAGAILERIVRESLFWVGDKFEQIPERYKGAI